MNKSEVVLHFHRQAETWQYISCAAVAAMIGLALYVAWLHIQLANCYAG